MGMMEDMMKRMMAEAAEEEARKPKPLPEAVIMELRAACERYQTPNPFAVGDVVTPRANSDIKDSGRPHLVVAVKPAEFDFSHGVEGSNAWGRNIYMRVIHQDDNGKIFAHWVESASFETYVEASK